MEIQELKPKTNEEKIRDLKNIIKYNLGVLRTKANSEALSNLELREAIQGLVTFLKERIQLNTKINNFGLVRMDEKRIKELESIAQTIQNDGIAKKATMKRVGDVFFINLDSHEDN